MAIFNRQRDSQDSINQKEEPTMTSMTKHIRTAIIGTAAATVMLVATAGVGGATEHPPECRFDLDGDGRVRTGDIVRVVEAYGDPTAEPGVFPNGSRVSDIVDALHAYGTECPA